MSLQSLKIQSLPRFSLNFAANIVAALWMLVGSVRAFNWVKPTFGQFVLFALLALAVNILLAWLTAHFGSDFNEQGLISYLIWPTIMLIACQAYAELLIAIRACDFMACGRYATDFGTKWHAVFEFAKLAAKLDVSLFTRCVRGVICVADSGTAFNFCQAFTLAMVGAGHYDGGGDCLVGGVAKKCGRSAHF